MAPAMRVAERVCFAVATGLACAGLSVLVLFAAVTLLDGMMRFFLSRPIEAVGDLGAVVVASAMAACFPLAQLQRANITIEILGMALGGRAVHALRAFGAVLVAVVLAGMTRQMLRYAADSAEGGDTTVMLGVATFPFWYVVAAMFACAVVAQALVVALSVARCLRQPVVATVMRR